MDVPMILKGQLLLYKPSSALADLFYYAILRYSIHAVIKFQRLPLFEFALEVYCSNFEDQERVILYPRKKFPCPKGNLLKGRNIAFSAFVSFFCVSAVH